MSSGHSFVKKLPVAATESKSVVIASERLAFSICTTHNERSNLQPICRSQFDSKKNDRFLGASDQPFQNAGQSLSEAISCVYARDCQTRTVRFLGAEEMSQVLSNLPRWSAAIPTLLEFSFKH